MHNRAQAAAQAAEAAGKQGKFWEMHDKIFENAKDLTDENFAKWAGELGINADQFKKDMEDPEIKKKIADQQKLGTSLGARGTPAFFVNGRYLSGAQPKEAFKAIIDEEMKKADALIAKGIARDKVYDETIKAGKTAP
jgi:protein-disulfide isomerase